MCGVFVPPAAPKQPFRLVAQVWSATLYHCRDSCCFVEWGLRCTVCLCQSVNSVMSLTAKTFLTGSEPHLRGTLTLIPSVQGMMD